MDMPKTNFAPRVGLAYSPFGSDKTVVRAGFGVYFINFNTTYVQNTPGNLFNLSASATSQQIPGLKGFPFPDLSQFGVAVTSLSAIQKNWHDPYTMNWNLNIQQALPGTMRLQVAYVGNRGVHMIGPAMDLNRLYPRTAIRPYSGWGTISYFSTVAGSNYNALQVSLNKRMSHGMQFNVNYTWSHALDDAPPVFYGYADDHNPQLDYGTTESDVTHILQFDYVYQIPTAPRLPHWLGKGWQLNGVTEMRSGLPMSLSCSLCDPLHVGQANFVGGVRSDVVPGQPFKPANFNIPNNQINLAAFTFPADGTIGNSARDLLRGPAAINFDLSLFKKFRVREGQALEFRAEFFNIFNTPQFANPTADLLWDLLGIPAGKSTSTLTTVSNFGTYRQIQFALRYTF
jgi:hypothetical protein